MVATTASAQTRAASGRRFTLPDHGSFVIQVPPDWKEELRQPPNRLPPAITFAQGAKAQAVERDLPIIEFQGRSGPGFYFSATDRAPKPGEFKSLTQGIVRVGELAVTFTILTNEGQDPIVKQAIDALKGAVHEGV